MTRQAQEPMVRVVGRLTRGDKGRLDGLRARYLVETKQRISRAQVVRLLLRWALDALEYRQASELLGTVINRHDQARGSARERGS